MLARTVGLLIALLLSACGQEPPPSRDGVGVPVEPPVHPVRGRHADLFDENGVLRESDERVGGLVLPRGLTKVEELTDERRHVYTSELPPATLLRYFGPRLFTMDIEQRGHRITYRAAEPRGVRGGVVKLDVTIEPTSRHPSRIEIIERPPAPPEGVVIPAEEIRRHFQEQQRRAE